MTAADQVQEPPEEKPIKKRLESLDAFRGMTIMAMLFVIAVVACGYERIGDGLPQKMSWFGSLPISTWYHAEMGYELWEAEQLAAGVTHEQIKQMPEHDLKNVGVTLCDLVAPFFVFIVGACVPLSRSRRGGDWWRHVGFRTIMLILAGMLYVAMIRRQITWWWGVLQAIAIAYFIAALFCKAPKKWRWPILLGVGFFNLGMTEFVPWWTNALQDIQKPFGSLVNPNGSWLKPLRAHCLPWLSISWGVMAMIGVMVGEALTTKETKKIHLTCLTVGGVFVVLGLSIHQLGFATENYSLCFNKKIVTTSYAFFTAGLAALVYLAFYWVIDVWNIRRWDWPLRVFGVNPLLAYYLQVVVRRAMEPLGLSGAGNLWRVSGIFNIVTPENTIVHNWAIFLGGGEPAQWFLDFCAKGGYHGVMWGLIWTACLWLIVLICNKKGLFWKL
jgi:predicted acyltransferase